MAGKGHPRLAVSRDEGVPSFSYLLLLYAIEGEGTNPFDLIAVIVELFWPDLL